VSSYLKEQNPSIKVFLVDPPGSSLYNQVGLCPLQYLVIASLFLAVVRGAHAITLCMLQQVRSGVCYASQQAEAKVRRHRYCDR
jgi:cysteine synthase